MKIVRPWASEGDYFEVLVPEPEDWAELIESLEASPLATEERIKAACRYMKARLGINE